MTNSSVTVVENWKYWPYGDDAQTSSTSQRMRFAAMERDTEASHYYDHARTHDTNLGTFVTPDPIHSFTLFPQGWNGMRTMLAVAREILEPEVNPPG